MHDNIPKRVLTCSCCSQDGDDELRYAHAHRPPKENRSSPPFIDGVQSWERRAYVDTTGDQVDNEGVLESGILEELGTVIKDKVDTSKLLQTLEKASSDETF